MMGRSGRSRGASRGKTESKANSRGKSRRAAQTIADGRWKWRGGGCRWVIMVAKRIHRGVVKVREACAPKRVVAGAMCEGAAMEVVCVRGNGGCHRERGKPVKQSATRKGSWQLKCRPRSGKTRDAPRSKAKADASR